MAVQGVDFVIDGLENATTSVMKAAFLGVIDALVLAHDDAKEIISATDHSLEDLAEMGHPYGFKHPAVIHEPDETIHAQTGDYLDALTVHRPVSFADRRIIEGSVGIDGDADIEQLDRFLQLGTSKMRARPWAEYLVQTHGDRYAQAVEDRIEAEVAVQA